MNHYRGHSSAMNQSKRGTGHTASNSSASKEATSLADFTSSVSILKQPGTYGVSNYWKTYIRPRNQL